MCRSLQSGLQEPPQKTDTGVFMGSFSGSASRAWRARFIVAWQATICATGVLLAAPAMAMADSARFDIPAQPLSAALKAFAEQAHMQLLYQSSAVEHAMATPVAGDLEKHAALKQMLEGTGLEAIYSAESAATVRPIRAKAGAAATGAVGDEAGGKNNQSSWDRVRLARAEQGASVTTSMASSSAQSSDRSSESETLEEIVVTAQKREERLRDVPVPVTAIHADDLVNRDQLRLQDFFTSVPGLSVSPTTQSAQILSIRGITTGVGSPTVGVTVDDMPYGSSTNLGGGAAVPDIDPGDLAQVEVLRGPQGTLYGASSMGGLIKFATLDPSTDAVSGRIQAGASGVQNGDGLGYNLRGSVNVPLSEAVAIRGSGFTREESGYIDNPVLGIKGINEQRVSGGRISALWRASDAISLKLSALYQDRKGDGSPDVDLQPGLGDLQQNYLRGVGASESKVQAYSATVTARVRSADLTAVSGYNINEFSDSLDSSSSFAPGTGLPEFNKTTKFTQELRLTLPLSPAFDWLLGAFYTHEKSVLGQALVTIDPATGAMGSPLLNIIVPTTYREYAAFTNLTFHINDRFDIQFGGRESEIRQASLESTQSGTLLGGATVVSPEADSKVNAFTYLLTPRFKVSPDLMLYARLASGYRAAGSNVDPGQPRQYDPDKTQNYEAGLKGNLFYHQLSFDASIYYIDWKDIQLQLRDVNPPHLGYVANAGRARSQGVELSFEWRPLAGLAIATWVAWDDAELKASFPATSTVYGIAGDRLPNTSRFSGSVSLDQSFPIASGVTGFVGGSVSYVGNRVGFFTPTPQRQDFPGYARTDLRAGAKYNSWTLNLFVNNLADKRAALAGGLGTSPVFAFQYLQPRTAGVSLVRTF